MVYINLLDKALVDQTDELLKTTKQQLKEYKIQCTVHVLLLPKNLKFLKLPPKALSRIPHGLPVRLQKLFNHHQLVFSMNLQQ